MSMFDLSRLVETLIACAAADYVEDWCAWQAADRSFDAGEWSYASSSTRMPAELIAAHEVYWTAFPDLSFGEPDDAN